MLKFLLEKEFKQFRRNPFLPRVVIFMPCFMMLVMPWAADLETKNVKLAIVDNDRSSISQRLVNKAASSSYFNLSETADTYAEAMNSVEHSNSDIILEIPYGFERNLIKEGQARVLISANTVTGTKGMLGSTYLSMITAMLSNDLREEKGIGITTESGAAPRIEIVSKARFNPGMKYKVFMLPAIMVMLITLITGFLPALNIVGEKEVGTIEQINVTPVSKFTFIIAKVIPYWIIGFVVLTLCFLIAWLVYGLIPEGSLLTIYISTIIYVLVVSGFGIVISNHSSTLQQAMFLIFFFLIIFILLSGLLTPVRSMPNWAQMITYANPLRYFIEIMRSVYLKGSGLTDITSQLLALGGFALLSNSWAVLSYRKNS